MDSNVNSTVTVTKSQILQGAGDIKIDGTAVGAYQGGVKTNYSQEHTFIESDHVMGHVDVERMGTTLQVSTELEESTLNNLAIAWGIDTGSISSDSSSKVLSLTPSTITTSVTLAFTGMSAEDRTKARTYSFGKAVSVGQSGSSLQRGQKTVIPVTFEILLDGTNYGTVTDLI